MSSSNQPYPSLVLIQQILTRYGYPTMVIVGTLGNLLNIILFLRKTLRTTSCNNYFLASAFVNLIILNMGIIPIVYTYDRPWAITTIYCKIRSYMFNATQQMSRYLIVMACFDRFAVCSTNVRLRQFCRVHIARHYVIPSIIVIWLLMPIYMLVWNTAVNNSCTFPGMWALYNSIYGISLVGFLPPTLMFVLSLLIFRNLKSKQQRRQDRLFATVNIQVLTREARKQEKKDQQALGMLMIQVVVYVCTTTIGSSNLLYSVLTMYLGVNKTSERKSIESFITFITGMLNYSYATFSFYLFVLVSHLYRKQMKLVMLHFCRRCFAWIGNYNNNNNSVDESISMRRMNPRVQPIQQTPVISLSVTANQHYEKSVMSK